MINSYKCPKCQSVTKISNAIEVKSFGCSTCNSLFTVNVQNGDLNFERLFTYSPVNEILPIGSKANLKGEVYEIIGYLIKETNVGIFYWVEYTLKSKEGHYLYLSEADGHWILLEEIEEEIKIEKNTLKVKYKDITFQCYDATPASIVGAYGFFDINIPKKTEAVDFIAPPYLVSQEYLNNTITYYFGEHISKTDVKNAFSISRNKLPKAFGVGLVQPYFFNIYQTAITFCIFILLILGTHKIINKNRSEEKIIDTTIPFSEYRNKEYVSPSFELKGSAAPMRIDVSSEVSNSWAYAGVSIVNETTNEEVFAEKDIEYYSGYEDGYAWSEGSTAEGFYICGVGPGKYHLNVNISKNDQDIYARDLHLRAKWEGDSNWNFIVVIFMFVAAFGLIYGGNYLFEKSRWSDSSYSPFEEE